MYEMHGFAIQTIGHNFVIQFERLYLKALVALLIMFVVLKKMKRCVIRCKAVFSASRLVMLNAYKFQHLDPELRGTYTVAILAVGMMGSALQWASDEMKDNKDIVSTAIGDDATAIRYASERLRDDRDMMEACIRKEGACIEHASKRLKADIDLIMLSIETSDRGFAWAPDEMKGDKQIVLQVLAKNGMVYPWVDFSLRIQKEVILAAVNQNAQAYYDVPPQIRNDRDVVMACMSSGGMQWDNGGMSWYGGLPYELHEDEEIIRMAIKKHYQVVRYMPEVLRDNKELMMEVVNENAYALGAASARLRDDRDVVMAAIDEDQRFSFIDVSVDGLKYASARLKNDRSLVFCAAKKCGVDIMEYVGDELKDDPWMKEYIVNGGKGMFIRLVRLSMEYERCKKIYEDSVHPDCPTLVEYWKDYARKGGTYTPCIPAFLQNVWDKRKG